VFKAVARRPTWSEAWQLLGRWHYRVDHYNLLERIFSGLFLGGVPSGASSRQAIDALLKAQQLDPKRIQVYYDLARVYDTQKQDDKAIKVLQEAATLTPITTEELEISRRCRSLLTRLQRKHPPQSPGTGG
jgi:tetratricopeptide (TPR) repeat protein